MNELYELHSKSILTDKEMETNGWLKLKIASFGYVWVKTKTATPKDSR